MKKIFSIISLAVLTIGLLGSCKKDETEPEPTQTVTDGALDGFVDLGVTNKDGEPLYWAEKNLGATNPEDCGDYFAWGETSPYYTTTGGWPETPIWKTGKESGYDMQSYCGDSSFVEWSNPPYDITTKVLKPDFDAATAKNAKWRTPTSADFIALAAGCVWIWTDDYENTGKAGYIVYKAKNDEDKGKAKFENSWEKWDAAKLNYSGNGASEATGYTTSDVHIFLPITGLAFGTELYKDEVYYMSSTLCQEEEEGYSYFLHFSKTFVYPQTYPDFPSRCLGITIRPVTE
ncbi:MAG: hypothetical protein KBT04_06435 [Bacteroidales bacterium]|nr:hypothetical protein [Candidatus Colimorpha onthohippi]